MAPQILTEGQKTLRDIYKLDKFIAKPEPRRTKYFSFCDRFRKDLCDEFLEPDEDPDHETMVHAVALMAKNDGTLKQHIRTSKAQALADDGHWAELFVAAGATIYRAYLVAVEKGHWNGS